MITTDKTIRDIAVENPGATRLFEKLGIDYCCGGQRSLQDACTAAKLDVESVLQQLEAAGTQPKAERKEWASESMAALVDHILAKHHVYTRESLARIAPLLVKVLGVHAGNHPELNEVEAAFRALDQELKMHMMKEENILFPYIVQMEEAVSRGLRPAMPMFGTVQNPVHMMMAEHDSAGACLRRIRQASNDLRAPADACFSYHELYRALTDLEGDLHQHIHLENNLLFPRAVEMEAANLR